MARRVKDRNLDSRDARRKLKASGKPYWRAIGRGLHVGYRKGKTGGVWVIRRYLGKQAYQLETIAEADDFQMRTVERFSIFGRRRKSLAKSDNPPNAAPTPSGMR